MDVPLKTCIPAVLDQALARLAAERRMNKARLVREALTEFVVREEVFAIAVAKGRAAVDMDDFIEHDEVMREVDALLARTK
jgi:predicted transcriptional regulator